MFELKFGIIWESFVTFVTICFLVTTMPYGELQANVPTILFLTIFHAVGVILLVLGMKKVITDVRTDKYGEECYGKITDIHPTSNSINGRRELEAVVSVFIPNEGQSREFTEIVGIGISPYEVGDYIRGKFYEDDVNITEKIYPDYLPVNIRNALGTVQAKKKESSVQPEVVYESSDIILVDGVRYQKIK